MNPRVRKPAAPHVRAEHPRTRRKTGAQDEPDAPPELVVQPRRELRIGLVLYGGVALAIYIYGVALELWRLVRASRALEKNVYTEPLRSAELRASVDIVSGASAGGINGILLGKALTTGAPLDAVRPLWLDRADFAPLMRSPGEGAPKSLLRTDYFETQLANGLADMDALATGHPLERSYDLFVSGTRLQGFVRRFRDDLGQILQSRQYRKSFHLRYRQGYTTKAGLSASSRSDFGASKNASLVAVARATSAFPFAFEPRLIQDGPQTAHLFERDEPRAEYFSDGGILHNKPFTETVDAIFTRAAERPVTRWLLSVEPDPEHHDILDPPLEPEVVEVVSKALSGIPSYQSIAADLERFEERRRGVALTLGLLERVEDIVATPAVLLALNADEATYANFLNEQVLFPAYLSLRDELAIDDLSMLISDAAAFDPLRRARVRLGVEAFAAARANGLAGIDPSYELRRVYYLIDALDRRTENFAAETQTLFVGSRRKLWEAFTQIRQLLWRIFADRAAAPLALVTGVEPTDLPGASEGALRAAEAELAQGLEVVRNAVGDACASIDELFASQAAVAPSTDAPPPPAFAQIFARFELWDMFHASVEAVSGRRSRDRVAFARISPAAATATGVPASHKLAGDTLGHFGGFVRRAWRANDLLWGRLDAAEVVLRLLAGHREPQPSAAELRAEIEAAHLEILKAEQHPAAAATDYRAYLQEKAIGEQTIAVVPSAERARLAVRGAGVIRKMLGGLGSSPRLSSVNRTLYRWAGAALGLVLALGRWPVLAVWARDPAVAWLGTLVVVFALVWAVATVALIVIGIVSASWQIFLFVAGAAAIFVIWILLLGILMRRRHS